MRVRMDGADTRVVVDMRFVVQNGCRISVPEGAGNRLDIPRSLTGAVSPADSRKGSKQGTLWLRSNEIFTDIDRNS